MKNTTFSEVVKSLIIYIRNKHKKIHGSEPEQVEVRLSERKLHSMGVRSLNKVFTVTKDNVNFRITSWALEKKEGNLQTSIENNKSLISSRRDNDSKGVPLRWLEETKVYLDS